MAYRIGSVLHGCIDFRGALVGAVADGAGVACGGCAALGHGLARVSLANGLSGVPAGIQGAPAQQGERKCEDRDGEPAGGG
jgi:hypothetical protein